MIKITCDNCEKLIEVQNEQAGSKIPCPDCGDINRVPKSLSPESMGLPSEDGPEVDIMLARPAMFRAHPWTYAMTIIAFFGGLFLAGYARFSESVWDWLIWVGLGCAAIGLVSWIVWYVRYISQRVEVTNKRTTHRKGVLRKDTNEVLHHHIRNIRIDQSLWQRIVGTGDIVLDSSAGGGGDPAEIKVQDMPKPRHMKQIIDQYRRL